MNGTRTYTAEEMGIEATRTQVEELLNDSRSGGFFCIRGYENEHGEIADHYLQFGINYGAIKDRDIATLTEIAEGRRPLALDIKYGVWLDTDGIAHSRKAKGRIPSTVTLSIDMTDDRLKAAVSEVLDAMRNPAPARAEYVKEAKGLYENQSDGAIHIRDALAVSKVVRAEGDYEFSASEQATAIKKVIRGTLLTGRYRQFIFQGKPFEDGRARFESITVSGQAILSGTGDTTLFALPETVRENVREEVTA
jgi:hypothetical protein